MEHLLVLLDSLVDAGHTVVVVEHSQQIIKACDYVIDLGPGGREAGGHIVFAGTPEGLAGCTGSLTARYL